MPILGQVEEKMYLVIFINDVSWDGFINDLGENGWLGCFLGFLGLLNF